MLMQIVEKEEELAEAEEDGASVNTSSSNSKGGAQELVTILTGTRNWLLMLMRTHVRCSELSYWHSNLYPLFLEMESIERHYLTKDQPLPARAFQLLKDQLFDTLQLSVTYLLTFHTPTRH